MPEQDHKKRADADSFKAAGVMRPKTRRRFTQAQSKCLAGIQTCYNDYDYYYNKCFWYKTKKWCFGFDILN